MNGSQNKPHTDRWKHYLHDCAKLVAESRPLQVTGHLTKVAGLVIEAEGLQLPVGSDCTIRLPDGETVDAEIVGFSGNKVYMMPTNDVYGLVPGAKVMAIEPPPGRPKLGAPLHPQRRVQDHTKLVPVGESLLGRVLDGSGRPLDNLGPFHNVQSATLQNRPFNPLNREPISAPLDVGIRAINALMTVGRGQRMGLFAGSGVGKSVLLGMMARYTSADIIVVG
ncbi:MAG: flagellum-specific ATP synthase FliI, partial [Burkholderiales bacterium]|nr:flagellum-specific ATP synthase FliI [Burkholderiales bacterium]